MLFAIYKTPIAFKGWKKTASLLPGKKMRPGRCLHPIPNTKPLIQEARFSFSANKVAVQIKFDKFPKDPTNLQVVLGLTFVTNRKVSAKYFKGIPVKRQGGQAEIETILSLGASHPFESNPKYLESIEIRLVEPSVLDLVNELWEADYKKTRKGKWT